MKSFKHVETIAEITLVMTSKEAQLLLSMIQNPMLPPEINEPRDIRNLRESIWNELNSQGIELV
jgi:hypothetical protein